ncbi:MAG: hypothetical protein H0T56_10655 [Pseudaminobacter sp.]|nr:hypothetical protein [Pseudaminobacter sp.]
MKFFSRFFGLALLGLLSACAAQHHAPPADVPPQIEQTPAGIVPLTLEQDAQVNGGQAE